MQMGWNRAQGTVAHNASRRANSVVLSPFLACGTDMHVHTMCLCVQRWVDVDEQVFVWAHMRVHVHCAHVRPLILSWVYPAPMSIMQWV